jgi:hypothetical protein
MKTSDISDEAFLEAVESVNITQGRWCFIWDLEELFPGVPMKVLLSKARKLIRRHQMSGCYCGCRGDFEV